MKTLNIFFTALLLSLLMSSCENDGELIYLDPIKDTEAATFDNDIVLSAENSDQIVLSLVWNGQTLSVSNPGVYAPDILSTSVQASLSSTMDNFIESLESVNSKAYTGNELNALAKNLGAEPDVASTIYFCVKTSVASNIPAKYSNIMEVNVTPYMIDMSKGFILDSKMENTGLTLYSKDSDGIYSGFVGATAWWNYYLKEGDGNVWGNDGVDGTPFLISEEDSHWNFWYPGFGGCYHTVVNTVTREWSALYIPVVNITGDLDGEMVYDRPNNKWIFTFDATTSSVTIRLNATGKQYNYYTGTDDDAAIDTPVAFSGSSNALEFGTSDSDITVSVPQTGESSLIIDLSDPTAFRCYVESGSAEPEAISQWLWLSGADDNITDDWNFNSFLTLYDENTLNYAGVVYVDSKWGYKFYTEKEDWSTEIGATEESSALEGTLLTGGGNVPAPDAGLYFYDVSMKLLTYQLMAVESLHYSGLNDDWSFGELPATETAGVYTATITINTASEWGFKLYLNGSWDHFFGGYEGSLYYKGEGIKDDSTLEPGDYTLTVDLTKATYSIN